MSLVPTYYLASDGNLYESAPRGLDWFLCFDDEDPPELVMKNPGKRKSADECKVLAYKLMESLGMEADIIAGPQRHGRVFDGKMCKKSISFFLKITKPIPIDLVPLGALPVKNYGGCTIELCGCKLPQDAKFC